MPPWVVRVHKRRMKFEQHTARGAASIGALVLLAALSGCGCTGRARRDASVGAEPDGGPLGGPVDAGRSLGDAFSPRADVPPLDDAPRGPSGTPATIEIYSGNGMVVPQGFPSGDTMKVIVLDVAGQPVSGVEVTWTVTSGGAAVSGELATGESVVSRTDENGIARAGVRGEFGSMMTSALRSTIEARCAAGAVELHAFSSYSPPGTLPSLPFIQVTTPSGRDFGGVMHGTTVVGGLVVNVSNALGTEMNRGLAGVGVRFLPQEDPSGDGAPLVSCANATEGRRVGGTVFTDAMGNATCDLRVPDAPGTYYVGVRAGGVVDFSPFFLTVL